MSTEVKNVSNPLTLVLNIKSKADAKKVQEFLAMETTKTTINTALEAVGTVHFARFVFLSESELAIITSYDGDFEAYVDAFIDQLHSIFDTLLSFMIGGAEVTPIKKKTDEFLAYIKTHDRSRVGGVLQQEFCAYPNLTVAAILSCEDNK